MIIKDERTGKSASYSTTQEGFRKAYNHLNEIEKKSGHVASGDAARVREYAQRMGWR